MLSFPVCNYFKSLARIRSPYRHTVLSRAAAAEGLDSVKCSLAGPWLCGIYFLSRNMTSVGCELSLGSINTATFLSCRRPSCTPPLLRPVGRKGGVVVTQSPFLKSHLACTKGNRGSWCERRPQYSFDCTHTHARTPLSDAFTTGTSLS